MGIPIKIVRGTTKVLRITIKQANGSPYIMTEGEILRLGVTDNDKGGCSIFTKEVGYDAIDNNSYIITLKPGDTSNLDCDTKYYYDIGLQSGEDYFPIIEFSPFNVLPNASRIGDQT